jgi:hypothetical protein
LEVLFGTTNAGFLVGFPLQRPMHGAVYRM